MKKVEISVILCVYNASNSLEKSLLSILNQTFQDFEFIIIDDCSIDDTHEIINKFLIKDDRIRYIRNDENLGLTKSLNKAIKISNGRFIARIDADDISYDKRFELQHDFLSSNNYAMVGAQRVIKDYIYNNTWNDYLPLSTKEIRNTAIRKNPFFHSVVMIKKDILNEVQRYNETYKYVQDYELWSRIIYKYNVANLEDVLGEKIIKSDAISFRNDISFIRNSFILKAKWSHYRRGEYNFIHLYYILRSFYHLVKSFPSHLRRSFATN